MAITWRTTNLGLWGTGKGSDLTPEEVDANFWYLFSLYTSINDHLASFAVGIQGIAVHGDQMTITLTDSSTQGPFTLPMAQWVGRGPWTPTTVYFVNDIFDNGGALYRVLIDHTSQASFDPGYQIGGHSVYQLILQPPATILPTGGAIGAVLTKASLVDYAVAWVMQTFAALADVALGSPLDANDTLYWNGTFWTNQHYIKEQQLLQTKVQTVSSVAGVLTIDRSEGEIVEVSLTENIASVVVSNWAAAGYRGKIELKVTEAGLGTYTVGGLPVTKWGNGSPWVMTSGSGKFDRVIMTSDDAGSTVLGDVVNQNYS